MKLRINWLRMIRPLRLVIALAVAIILGKITNLPMSGWIIITTVVVLFDQATLGGTINRSILRLVATFFGAAISLVCIYAFHDNQLIYWSVLAGTTFVYAYIFMDSKKSYIGILGIATMAILLMGSDDTNLQVALLRLLDIFLGILIALVAMLVIFPEYAVNKSRELIFSSIEDIAELISTILQQNEPHAIRAKVLQVETKFTSDVVNFNKTIDEAKFELKPRHNRQFLAEYKKCYLQIRRLYRLVIVLSYYELENIQLEDPQIKQIFAQLLLILAELNPDKSVIQFEETRFEQVLALNQTLLSPTLQKTILSFTSELQLLNQILARI